MSSHIEQREQSPHIRLIGLFLPSDIVYLSISYPVCITELWGYECPLTRGLGGARAKPMPAITRFPTAGCRTRGWATFWIPCQVYDSIWYFHDAPK